MQESQGKSKKQFQHVADVVGSWGPTQWKIFLIASVVYIIAPYQNLSLVLYTQKSDFWCTDPPVEVNNITRNVCEVDKVKCRQFDFDKSFYRRTFTTEFQLVCDREWYGSLAQSLHQLGYAISGIGFGFVSDNYGRKFCLKTVLILEVIASCVQAFTSSTILLLANRVLLGASAYGRFMSFYVLIMEWVGPELRATCGILGEIGYSIGYMSLPIVFYFVLDYRILQSSVAISETIAFFVVLIFIPESPRWQMTHDKYEEAEKSMYKAAKKKGKLTDEEIRARTFQVKTFLQEQMEIEQTGTVKSILATWRNPKLLKLSLCLYMCWYSQAFIYYGSIFNLGQLGANVFLNLFIFGLSYLIATFFTYYCLTRLGRRKLMAYMFFIEGIAFFLLVFCYFLSDFKYLDQIKVVLAFTAAFTCSGGFNVLYLYTAETFPTTARQSAIGTCAIFARFGSMVAPFMKELSIATHVSVSLAIFAALSAASAFACTLIPETRGKEMPDTVGQTGQNLEVIALKVKEEDANNNLATSK